MFLILSLEALVDLYLNSGTYKLDLGEAILWLVQEGHPDPGSPQLRTKLSTLVAPRSNDLEADLDGITEVIKYAAARGCLIWRVREHHFTLRGGFQQMMALHGYRVIGDFCTSYEEVRSRIKSENDLQIFY